MFQGKIQGERCKERQDQKLKNWRVQEGTRLFWKNIDSQDIEKHHRPCSPPALNGDGALQEFICQGIHDYEYVIFIQDTVEASGVGYWSGNPMT